MLTQAQFPGAPEVWQPHQWNWICKLKKTDLMNVFPEVQKSGSVCFILLGVCCHLQACCFICAIWMPFTSSNYQVNISNRQRVKRKISAFIERKPQKILIVQTNTAEDDAVWWIDQKSHVDEDPQQTSEVLFCTNIHISAQSCVHSPGSCPVQPQHYILVATEQLQ